MVRSISRGSFLRGAAALCALKAGPSQAAPADSGAIIGGRPWMLQSAGQPWNFSNANGVLRFEVRPGDTWRHDAGRVPPHARTEIRDSLLLQPGAAYWVSFSNRITTDRPLTSNETIFAQLHASDEPTDKVPSGPIIDFRIDGQGRFSIRSSYSLTNPTTQPNYVALYTSPDRFVFGRWDRYVAMIKVGRNPAGSALKVWRNGALVVDRPSLPLGYINPRGPYWKTGLYRLRDEATVLSEVRDLTGPGSMALDPG